ncbi:TPA: hypothetical protein EYP66_01365 [Candidatus Poribacteria bacterium]|nr:hypothetical protein [Candidatus Poribacteria bacterium]
MQVYPVQYVRQAVDTVVSSKLENQRALYLLALMYGGVSLLGTALRMLQRILASRMTMHNASLFLSMKIHLRATLCLER